jgi:hypothetical protein
MWSRGGSSLGLSSLDGGCSGVQTGFHPRPRTMAMATVMTVRKIDEPIRVCNGLFLCVPLTMDI